MNDEAWMEKALDLARLGEGQTSPNPAVGAVLVRDGRMVGSGFHRGSGQPHAEIEAIRDGTRRGNEDAIAGSTLYVTLEPCSTHGRTGACTDAICKAGIGTVVYGCEDPNPMHAGRGARVLEEAGVAVRRGVLGERCEHLVRGFAKVQKSGLPWIIAKTALSLDGRITRPPGEGQWLSSPASRVDVQEVRSSVDAILTSGQTVRKDDPRLTVRLPNLPPDHRQPWRVILSSREDGVPQEARILCDEYRERTLVFTGQRIEQVLRTLVSDHGVCTVLVEAGGRLLGRFFDEHWVDELVAYYAPIMTGGAVPAVGGEGVGSLAERIGLQEVSWARIGSDLRLRACLGERAFALER